VASELGAGRTVKPLIFEETQERLGGEVRRVSLASIYTISQQLQGRQNREMDCGPKTGPQLVGNKKTMA